RVLPVPPAQEGAGSNRKNATQLGGQRLRNADGPRMAADGSASADYSSDSSDRLSGARWGRGSLDARANRGWHAQRLSDGRAALDGARTSPRPSKTQGVPP